MCVLRKAIKIFDVALLKKKTSNKLTNKFAFLFSFSRLLKYKSFSLSPLFFPSSFKIVCMYCKFEVNYGNKDFYLLSD
jgi:hypothetical protein